MKRLFFIFLFLWTAIPVHAEKPENRLRWDEKVPLKTSGGIWFWGDVLFFHDWHIQKNVHTGSYRLLDGKSFQRALGTFEDCQNRLEEIQVEEGFLPMSGSALIILHGFGSNALTTRLIAQWFRENGRYDHVLPLSYPSTQQSILDHAKMLDCVVKNLPPTVKRIDFVGHSLGSIVTRRYLSGPLESDWQVPEDRLEARGKFVPDTRVGRFVMLGPPNHGAELARKLIGNNNFRRRFTGRSGDELGIDWSKTEKTLGIPCCPFAIIAGGRGDGQGFSVLIDGDNDGVVSTEGTKLEGAEHWLQFHLAHSELLQTEEVFEVVLRFLETGSFANAEMNETGDAGATPPHRKGPEM